REGGTVPPSMWLSRSNNSTVIAFESMTSLTGDDQGPPNQSGGAGSVEGWHTNVNVAGAARVGRFRPINAIATSAAQVFFISSPPTRVIKRVVTDDRGRFVIPDLPKGDYDVWVRGYGLVDSAKIKASPGKTLNLTASAAPDAKAAAQYYPAQYWYALMQLPPK